MFSQCAECLDAVFPDQPCHTCYKYFRYLCYQVIGVETIHELKYGRTVITICSDRFEILGLLVIYYQLTRFHTFVDDEFVYELATANSLATG